MVIMLSKTGEFLCDFRDSEAGKIFFMCWKIRNTFSQIQRFEGVQDSGRSRNVMVLETGTSLSLSVRTPFPHF